MSKFDPAQWNESFELSKEDGVQPPRGSVAVANTYGHGAAMNEMCTVNDLGMNWLNTSKGFSKAPWDGGFNAMHTGVIGITGNKETGVYTAIREHYGYTTIFYSSSTDYAGTALTRHLNLNEAAVKRYNSQLNRLYSVRCVKNEIRY